VQNIDIDLFPQKRLDAMIAAATSIDRFTPQRAHVSSGAMNLLTHINPAAAMLLELGREVRGDAAEGVTFARNLEHVRLGLYDFLFPELEGMRFVPLEPGVDPGKEIYTYQGQKRIGRAALMKHPSDDLPNADVQGIEAFVQMRQLGAKYCYTLQEQRAVQSTGQPIDVRKAMAARLAIATLVDEIIFYGSTEGALVGLLNQSNTTSYTVANGAAGSKRWALKTSDEIVADMHGIVNNVVKTTLGIHRPDSMLLPLAAFQIAATKRMGDGDSRTCLQFFLATSPSIKNVDPSYRLDAANSALWGGSANTGRFMVYEKKPDRLSLILPIEFSQQQPFVRHFVTETACEAKIGGVVAPYPGAISYGDGITTNAD
jgi:hypothetical protein